MQIRKFRRYLLLPRAASLTLDDSSSLTLRTLSALFDVMLIEHWLTCHGRGNGLGLQY
jgi:hypothetical protein